MAKYIGSVRFLMKNECEFGESPSESAEHYETKRPVTVITPSSQSRDIL